MKLRLNKFYGYVSVFILITLIVILLFCVYKSTRFYEGLAPVSAPAPEPEPEPASAPATAPTSSSPTSSSPSDNSAKGPSVATFDVNSAASFALLAEGEMLNPPPSSSPIVPPTNWFQPDSFRVPFLPSDTIDPIYMNKSTNLSQVTPVQSNNLGFCSEQSNYPDVKESKCNALSNETCASTECCVLLGGEKCVAGNEQGPLIETNYSNFLIKNRVYYYYQGKCYGNCGNQ